MTAIVNTDTALLCVELRTLARLSGEEHVRHGWRYPDLFPELHFAICHLRDAVLTHFDNEQTLLFPLVRRLENGEPRAALDLRRLVPGLTAEQCQILDVLASIKAITRVRPLPSDSPLLRMLLSSLRRVDRDLRAWIECEERELSARVMVAEPGAPAAAG